MGNSNTMVTRILELSRRDPEQLKELEKFRRSVSILFTDIQGSTAYYEQFGDLAGLAMVHECNDALRRVVEEHDGRVIKNIGDAIMACFDSCEQSVRATIVMQRRLSELNSTKKEEDRAHVRIGVHYGVGIVKSNDVFGDVVNVASRIQSLAQPEQILISDSLFKEVVNCGFDISPLGRFQLKGKSEMREVFEVRWNQQGPIAPDLAQTILVSEVPQAQKFTIRHLNRKGEIDAEGVIPEQGVTIGRTQGDFTFPNDSSMYSPHARFFLNQGQVTVEDISMEGGVFLRLRGVLTLENRDIIVMGGQLFRFDSQPDIMAAATAVAISLPDIRQILNQYPAEFVRINADAPGQQSRFPFTKEEVRFGRTTGDYTFPEDRSMSRLHARVYLRGEDYFLEDLGSLNGTFVKIRGQTHLPPGASVRVGREVFLII